MNILYIAYSCSPYHGSEDKIGWNIPLESAKTNNVFVITKEEQREYIEKYLEAHNVENIKFYYVDIPSVYKQIFKGMLYSGRLNIWNSYALTLAEEICRQEKIQIVHQITPIEFRSVGNYASIPNVKFVCGPIAGGQAVPKCLMCYAGKYRWVEWLRNFLNKWYQQNYQHASKLAKCDFIWFANNETRQFLSKYICEQKQALLPDVSVGEVDLNNGVDHTLRESQICKFVVVGRLVHLKGHDLLFDALERISQDYECQIVGEGIRLEALKKRCHQKKLGERVRFVGSVPYTEMEKVYNSADVLIMPSLREATGSVVLEAMANGLPVITINKFGGAVILNDETGWLYDGNTKEAYIENLRNAIKECIQNPEEVKRRGQNARDRAEEFVWEKKMECFSTIYESVMRDGA